MYTKVSIPKNGDGAGAATIKSPTVIIMDVEDIATEPSREVGDTELNGNYTLKTGANAVGILRRKKVALDHGHPKLAGKRAKRRLEERRLA